MSYLKLKYYNNISMEDSICDKNGEDNNILNKKKNILNDQPIFLKKKDKGNNQDLIIKKDKKKKKKKKYRCPICNIKLTLVEKTIFCSCKKSYCTKHRLPEQHNCNYNFKNDKKKYLTESNPDVNFKKIDEI